MCLFNSSVGSQIKDEPTSDTYTLEELRLITLGRRFKYQMGACGAWPILLKTSDSCQAM